jgi:hypothetical protein
MQWFKLTAISVMAFSIVACSGEKKEDMQPEDLPVDQEQVAPAPDTTQAVTDSVPASVKPSATAPKRTVNTQAVPESVGDGSIQKSTTKKGADGTVMTTQKEEAAPPVDDGGIEKSTTKKKK